MIFTKLPLKDAYLINLEKDEDERGFFCRYWCKKEYLDFGLDSTISQINNSFNILRGTMRGLHFQYPPKSETKIVRCISGAIWDVIVDIRYGSPTYGQWFGENLTDENRKMMYVPKGFAHGFISLTENSEIIYLSSQKYEKNYEGGLHWNDSFHGIDWPLKPIVISKKDASIKSWGDKNSIIIRKDEN